VIISLLHAVVEYRQIQEGLKYDRQRTKRMALDISRDMSRLANLLDSFQRELPFVVGTIKEWHIGFPLNREKGWFFPVALVEQLPSVLKGYAELLEHTWGSAEFGKYFQSPAFDLPMLALYVKGYTGKRYYSELCALLDAADCYTFGCRGDSPRQEPGALRNLINRFRKRHSSCAQRLDEFVSMYRKTYCPDRFSPRHFLTSFYQKATEAPVEVHRRRG
jgi:hypothetical protein